MNIKDTPLLNSFWAVAGAVNIRIKIIGIVLGMVFLLGVSVTLQVRHLLSQSMYAQLTEQAIAFTRDLAARAVDPMLINDVYALHQLVQDTKANHPNVVYAFVMDTDDYLMTHTFNGGFPQHLTDANSVTDDAYEHTVILNTSEGQIWDTAVPIFEGRAGTARLGLSDVQMRQTVDTVTGQLLFTTVMVSMIGISAAVFLTWVLTRPILELVHATQVIGRGDFSYRATRWADDEIGKLTDSFNTMIEALEKAHAERLEREQMRAQYVQGVILAQEEERKRIARELHDSTSQSLTSLMIGLRTLEDTCQNCRKQSRVVDLRAIVGQTLHDVHTLSVQLRPSVLDDLGLTEAVRRHVADCQKRVAFNIDLAIIGVEGQRLAPEIETALYRIIQEGLTNIMRYADPQNASICIEYAEDRVLVVIEDDGKGFDVDSVRHQDGHLGLYGIRERAELLNGKVEIESTLGHGTTLYVDIPIHNRENQHEPH